jgi:coniferyl-aldehyde dehydrogenase
MATKLTDAVRPDAIRQDMLRALEKARAAYLAEMPVGAAIRKDRINRALDLLIKHGGRLAEALRADFGHRSIEQTMLTDIAGACAPLRHARDNLDRWMRPEKRRAGPFPLNLLGAKLWIEHQPLGVVGIIAPWNFPVQLTFSPLADVFAAGNRVMIKPSEFTPQTSALMAELMHAAYDPAEVSVWTGGPDVGQAFSGLPFDHLLFTGATSVGRHVMRAAADNLVPVTLELGGKSPVILGRSANMAQAADRIVNGKMLNAGQICLAPDYLMVPQEQAGEAVAALKAAAAAQYPTLLTNPDYTSIVNARHADRLKGYIDDAVAQGAKATVVNPGNEDFNAQVGTHKMPLTILENVHDQMKVMQDEIFGPVLPVMTYSKTQEAIDYVNQHPRPLGLYYFGNDAGEERQVLEKTTSGGVTLNDVIFHVAQENAPFGGVGPAGMGAYHGHDGFKTFSHAKTIYKQPTWLDIAKLGGSKAPYGPALQKTLKMQIKK